jgi:hypothetical protein
MFAAGNERKMNRANSAGLRFFRHAMAADDLAVVGVQTHEAE